MTPLLLLSALLAPPPVPIPRASPRRPIAELSMPMLYKWHAGTASCDGVTQAVQLLVTPQPFTAYGPLPDATRITALTFVIDAVGRPHAIARDRADIPYLTGGDDVVPAFAATRFAPGPARRACTVRFYRTATTISDAPLASIYPLTIPPIADRIPALLDRIRPADATCDPAWLEPLLISVPSYRAIPKLPGRRSWAVVRFDVDADGRPRHVTVVASNGNNALDAAGQAAVAGSRFEPGARTGCLWPYSHNAGNLPAPETPSGITDPPPGSTCPTDLPWVDPLILRFPENYRRRAIEGWAAIGYDLAPWGQTGNVHVIAAEPAADFGEAAADLIRTGRKPASPTGHTGCAVVVRYKMNDGPPPASAEPPPPF